MMTVPQVQELVFSAIAAAMTEGGGTFNADKAREIGDVLVGKLAGKEITGEANGLSPATVRALILSGMVAAITREELNEARWKMINDLAMETMWLSWGER